MADDNTQLYEGMFLFNIQAINGELNVALEHMQEILNRAEAEVVALSRWDERKLAYEIKGQKRGLYLLAYFKVRGAQIANIERDVNLSEYLLRCLILRADHMGEVEIEQAIAEAAKTADHAAVAGEKQVGDVSDDEVTEKAVVGDEPESVEQATADAGAGEADTAEDK
jgi:small subunit ribosomal protein S6